MIVLVDGWTVDRGYITIINPSLSQPPEQAGVHDCYVTVIHGSRQRVGCTLITHSRVTNDAHSHF